MTAVRRQRGWLTVLPQVDHPVQQHQRLHHGGQQERQAEVHHHPALLLQHGLHPLWVQGQPGRQADPGQTQTGVPVREQEEVVNSQGICRFSVNQ